MTRGQAMAGLALVLLAIIFARLVSNYAELEHLRPLAAYYVQQAPADLGAANVVTAVLITYRGFDTLGEVAVLFMVAASVGVVLERRSPEPAESDRQQGPSEIVSTCTGILVPIILVFGAYVIVNGHLSAGGGFQGGAIVASAVLLKLVADPGARISLTALSITESLAGILYVGLGVLGIVLAGGFLDSRFLPLGQFGTFLSGGAIPLVSALLGIKVGAELSVILERFRD